MNRPLPRVPSWFAVLLLAILGSSLPGVALAQPWRSGLTHYADPEGSIGGASGEAEDVVLVKATFGPDGAATRVDAIRGKKALRPTAIGAVRQWVYGAGTADTVTILVGVNVARTTGGWQPDRRPPPLHTREPRTAPRKVVDVRPLYPPGARRKHLEGMVIAEIVLDAEGRVASAYVVRGVEGLNEAALETVLRWRFEAGEGGYTFPLQMTVTVNFRLP